MKHTGLKKLFSLMLVLGLVCTLIPAQALTLGELPTPVELNADAEAPSFQMTGLNGTTISSSELDGKPAILLFGRTTCFNCNYFMKGIKDALPLLQQYGVSFLVGLADNPSDEEVLAFSNEYGSCRCGKITNYFDNGMWNGLEAAGADLSGFVTFPVIFIRDKNNHLRYYSTGPYSGTSHIRSVASAALQLAGAATPTVETTIDLALSPTVISRDETVYAYYKVNNPNPNGRIVYKVEVEGSNEMRYTDIEFDRTGSLPAEGVIQYTLTNPYAQKATIVVEQLTDGVPSGYAEATVLNRSPIKMNLQFTVADPAAQYAPGDTIEYDSEVSGTQGLGTAEIAWMTEIIDYNGKEDDETAWSFGFAGSGVMTDVTDGTQWYEVRIPADAQTGEIARTTFTFTCGGWTKTVVKESLIGTGAGAVNMEKIKAFVNRCYTVILGRSADPEGLEAWAVALASGQAQASQIIDGIVNSLEYQLKNLSNEESVKVLYRAMLGRDPDPAGLSAWTDVLNQGYPFGSVINGFCGSTEFGNICAGYGIQPGSVNVGPVVPGPADDSSRGKIEAFVKRCYVILLERGVDPTGLKDWSDALETGVAQASQIIDGIVNSQEFQLRGLTNEQKVDCLYQAMLGRGADPDGRAAWVQALVDGYPYAAIINGFCGSTEFINICNDYGIQPGSVQVKGTMVKRVSIDPENADPAAPVVRVGYNSEFINEEKVRAFVKHCYESVLGREGDAEGVEAYTALILNGEKTPKRVAYEFVFSPEFQGKLPGNEAFIRILYKLYLNREPNAEELAGWVAMLEGGTGLEEIVKGFADGAEFRAIVREMKE